MLHVHLADTDYPTSDGKPMAETDVHRDQMIDVIHALQSHFRGQRVYVSGNLLLYYEENDRNKHCAPDVLVALGLPSHQRESYLLWKEGKAPDFVIEVTSKSTQSVDLGKKKKLYARLGVREYCIFDPLRDYLIPQIRLYRLSKGEYLPVTGKPLHLTTVGLDLEIADNVLRLRVPGSETYLPTIKDEEARADAEKARADAATARAEKLARRLEQLGIDWRDDEEG